MRILLVYASRYGHTRRIAERIASVTRESGAEVHLFEVSDLPKGIAPHVSDVVVVLGPVYFGRHSKKLEDFATSQRTHLAKVKSVFVSVSGASRTPEGRKDAETAAREFAGRTGWAPDRVELVAGGEPYTRYGWLTRWFMVRHSKKFGRIVDPKVDYDFTDWSQVEALARELVGVKREVREPVRA